MEIVPRLTPAWAAVISPTPMMRFLVLLLLMPWSLSAMDEADYVKCLALIDQVKAHGEWVFIRNGKEHPVEDAVRLMTYKLKDQRDRLTSVEDFIDTCVTKSSTTGRLYEIRTSATITRPCAEVLRSLLKTPVPPSPGP